MQVIVFFSKKSAFFSSFGGAKVILRRKKRAYSMIASILISVSSVGISSTNWNGKQIPILYT